ncbi:MAG: thioredoxin family protein [Fibrobacterota bacterium]
MKQIAVSANGRFVYSFATFAVLILSGLLPAESSTGHKPVTYINSVDEFKEVIESSEDRLLVFDLYADWCMPCKILGPRLEKVAADNQKQASVYKINVDKHPGIAGMFGVRGIPYVVFVKEKTAIHAITGVQPEGVYDSAIKKYYK